MSDCCSNTEITDGQQAVCPVNGHAYRRVNQKTLLHQIKKPWQQQLDDEYYFCTDPDCCVVYFSAGGKIIDQSDIRPHSAQMPMICYCFDIAVSDIGVHSKAALKNYVIQKTKENLCDCQARNPSGRCCLRNFN